MLIFVMDSGHQRSGDTNRGGTLSIDSGSLFLSVSPQGKEQLSTLSTTGTLRGTWGPPPRPSGPAGSGLSVSSHPQGALRQWFPPPSFHAFFLGLFLRSVTDEPGQCEDVHLSIQRMCITVRAVCHMQGLIFCQPKEAGSRLLTQDICPDEYGSVFVRL
ncbi:hypothetical protein QQF64_017197 [Cirrhinus molitorella]|uniref:Uncharacterized protein n=2 Tax=Cirrhinus molitorella TaxID=172907 RepID=A0ABR3LL93_9TELE|nr:hypothetical protein Q8A67_022960 [Cirrhinus molitorella]